MSWTEIIFADILALLVEIKQTQLSPDNSLIVSNRDTSLIK